MSAAARRPVGDHQRRRRPCSVPARVRAHETSATRSSDALTASPVVAWNLQGPASIPTAHLSTERAKAQEFQKRLECEDSFDYVGSSSSWTRYSSERDLRCYLTMSTTRMKKSRKGTRGKSSGSFMLKSITDVSKKMGLWMLVLRPKSRQRVCKYSRKMAHAAYIECLENLK